MLTSIDPHTVSKTTDNATDCISYIGLWLRLLPI